MHQRLAAATASAGLLLGYSTAFAGTSFTQVTTVNGQRAAVTKTVTDSGNAKAEFVEMATPNPFMPAGGYMLFESGAMYFVNPAARTYSRFDPAMIASMAQAMGRMEVSDVAFEKVLDEAGESILGYPTRHYQFKSSWSMGIQGMPVKTQISVVEDIWATSAIEVPDVSNALSGAMAALPEQVQAIANAQGARNIEGFPLRQVSMQSTKISTGGGLGGLGARMAAGMAGAVGDTTTTVEVTELAQVDVPASAFELPAGFEETALFPAMPNQAGLE